MLDPQSHPGLACVVCGQSMLRCGGAQTWRCPGCHHFSSSFDTDGAARQALDELQREVALRELRVRQARITLSIVHQSATNNSRSLCDVGCGHGWFMDMAMADGFTVLGIEPDADIAAAPLQRGLPIRIGRFPECLEPEEQFDVLTFNDVWEHLQHARCIAAACRLHLKTQGLLVIVAPSSEGILFRLARILTRLGVTRPWDRLWQRSFPSPHRHYYTPSGLARLLSGEGFVLAYSARHVAVQRHGLWQRLRMNRQSSWLGSAVNWTAISALLPALEWLPADIMLQVYRVEQCGSHDQSQVDSQQLQA